MKNLTTNKRQSRQAFTMVELLVVLSILGVLVGILLPVLGNVRENGWKVTSINNLRQLATANNAYLADHGHYAPANNQDNTKRWCAAKKDDDTFDPAAGYLADYLGETGKVNHCPKLAQMLDASDSFEEGTGGYGYNDNYIGGQPEGQDGGYYAWDRSDPSRPRIAARGVHVIAPAKTVMFTTTALAKADGIQEYPFSHPPFWDFGGSSYSFSSRPTPSVHFRFRGKALVAWCDGRVSTESPDARPSGDNPYGGDAEAHHLGWFGPDERNGYWNPDAAPDIR